MAGENLRRLVDRSLGTQVDSGTDHAMTVKIPEATYAKLRALVNVVGRAKTPLASDILVAAIDDFIEALPNDPLDEAMVDKLRGVSKTSSVQHFGDIGLRDLVLWMAKGYGLVDQQERWDKETAAASSEPVSQNGAHN